MWNIAVLLVLASNKMLGICMFVCVRASSPALLIALCCSSSCRPRRLRQSEGWQFRLIGDWKQKKKDFLKSFGRPTSLRFNKCSTAQRHQQLDSCNVCYEMGYALLFWTHMLFFVLGTCKKKHKKHKTRTHAFFNTFCTSCMRPSFLLRGAEPTIRVYSSHSQPSLPFLPPSL